MTSRCLCYLDPGRCDPDCPIYDDAPFGLIPIECSGCDGEGYLAYRITVYEQGCGFPHDDTAEEQCEACHGSGVEWVAPAPWWDEDVQIPETPLSAYDDVLNLIPA